MFKDERIESFKEGPNLSHRTTAVGEVFQEREVLVAEKGCPKCLALAKRL